MIRSFAPFRKGAAIPERLRQARPSYPPSRLARIPPGQGKIAPVGRASGGHRMPMRPDPARDLLSTRRVGSARAEENPRMSQGNQPPAELSVDPREVIRTAIELRALLLPP